MDPNRATKCDPQYNRHTLLRVEVLYPQVNCLLQISTKLWWITRVYCLNSSWRSGRTLRLALLFGEGPHTSGSFSPKKKFENNPLLMFQSLLNDKYLHLRIQTVPPLIIWRLVWHVASPWSAQRPFFKKKFHILISHQTTFSRLKSRRCKRLLPRGPIFHVGTKRSCLYLPEACWLRELVFLCFSLLERFSEALHLSPAGSIPRSSLRHKEEPGRSCALR